MKFGFALVLCFSMNFLIRLLGIFVVIGRLWTIFAFCCRFCLFQTIFWGLVCFRRCFCCWRVTFGWGLSPHIAQRRWYLGSYSHCSAQLGLLCSAFWNWKRFPMHYCNLMLAWRWSACPLKYFPPGHHKMYFCFSVKRPKIASKGTRVLTENWWALGPKWASVWFCFWLLWS